MAKNLQKTLVGSTGKASKRPEKFYSARQLDGYQFAFQNSTFPDRDGRIKHKEFTYGSERYSIRKVAFLDFENAKRLFSAYKPSVNLTERDLREMEIDYFDEMDKQGCEIDKGLHLAVLLTREEATRRGTAVILTWEVKRIIEAEERRKE